MLWQNRLFGEHSFHKLQLLLAPSTTTSRKRPHAPIPKFYAANSRMRLLTCAFCPSRKGEIWNNKKISLPFHSTVRTITQLLCLSFYFTCILDSETQSLRTTSLWWSTFGKDCILGCMSTPKISDCRFWPWTALLPHLRTEVRSRDTLL